MTLAQRILLATAILAVDTAVFFLPVSALVLAYLIIFDPSRLNRWTRQISQPGD